MKRKVLQSLPLVIFAVIFITFCVHGISSAAQASLTGESSAQEKKDNDYLAEISQRPEVSFLDFQPGPFVNANDIFYSQSLVDRFVRLHSPYSSCDLTLEEVKKQLYYVHSHQANLEQMVESMVEMRKNLSAPEKQSIDPVYYNDEPEIYKAGKQNQVEVPKVIYHAYLNGEPYAAVVRFDAFSGEGSQMKLYQGYMTYLKDGYDWQYYHCSGLIEVQ